MFMKSNGIPEGKIMAFSFSYNTTLIHEMMTGAGDKKSFGFFHKNSELLPKVYRVG